MRVLLTITKDKRSIYCGHVFLINNLLIEQGTSAAAVEQKVKAALINMYEIMPDALQLVVRGHCTLKAVNLVNKLKKNTKPKQTEVWLNSRYFDVS